MEVSVELRSCSVGRGVNSGVVDGEGETLRWCTECDAVFGASAGASMSGCEGAESGKAGKKDEEERYPVFYGCVELEGGR